MSTHKFQILDSRAKQSVIKSDEFLQPPKMSDRSVNSIRASAKTVVEKYMTTLSCKDDKTGLFMHSVLLFKCWLINSMGKDVMCILGICRVSTPEKIIATRLGNLCS